MEGLRFNRLPGNDIMPDRVRQSIRWAILRAREEERRRKSRLRRRKMAAATLGLIALSAATYFQIFSPF